MRESSMNPYGGGNATEEEQSDVGEES